MTGEAGTWTPLVDEDTFDAVQARLADPRRKTQQGTHRKHLGSGLYECADCGASVRSWSADRYRCPAGCLTRSQRAIDDLVLGTIRARLARPDLADLITPEESERARQVGEQVKRLRARLVQIEEDYDRGDVDGRRFKTATAKVQAELTAAQRVQARLSTGKGAASTLLAADPVAAFDAAPLMIRRTVIEALCTVRLAPTPRGRKTFDPASVEITWKKAAS